MTTNAIDVQKFLVGSDSRWSCQREHLLYFVDDTEFDKIIVNDDAVMICAGDGQLIGEWAEWLRKPDYADIELPRTEIVRNGQTETICVTILGRPDGAIMFIKGSYYTIDMHALFAGSGAEHAHGCFTQNKSVKKCIETARDIDDLTGGEVRLFDVTTGEHNLSNTVQSFDHVDQEFRARGKVMDLNTKKIMDINPKSAANDAPGAIQAGSIHLSAPTGAPYSPWTEEDKNRLRAAVTKLAERAAARKLAE